MKGIALTNYWPLWLLALLPLVWWAAARSRSNLGKGRLRLATVLRSLVLVALALALAQPVLNKAQRDSRWSTRWMCRAAFPPPS